MLLPRRALLIGAAALAIARPARASLPVPPSGFILFKVIRNGDQIGQHRLDFSRDGDRLTVTVDVRIEVFVAFIRVFHYMHHNIERWRDGTFVGFEAQTDDDGKHYVVSATRQAAGIAVQGDKMHPYMAPASALCATHWNQHELDVPMINPQNGRLLHPRIARDGVSEVPLADGKDVAASKYVLTGDMRLVLWYAAAGAWTALSFKADDGSTVDYRLAS